MGDDFWCKIFLVVNNGRFSFVGEVPNCEKNEDQCLSLKTVTVSFASSDIDLTYVVK